MTTPTTLPEALMEIEELRGQVRDLLHSLGQEAPPSAAGISLSPEGTTGAFEFSEGLVPKQAGKATAQHLLDLHQMVETVPDVIFKLDLQGNLAGWNKRLAIVTGYSPQELANKPALSFVPEHEHAKTAAAIRRAFEEGYAELEGHMLTKAGRTIPYHWTGAALKNEDGIAIGIAGVGRDINERKKIESALRISEERLRLAMDIAQVATWEWDIPTNKLTWSENCERVKRIPPGTFDGTFEAYQQLLHPDDLPRLFADINRALVGPDSYHTEHRIVPPGGEIQWIEGNGAVYRDETGRPIRMIGTARNITERKKTEEAIKLAERQYRTIFEQAGAGVAQIDSRTGQFVQVNRKYCEIVGMTEAEMLATTFMAITHPDDLEADLVNMEQLRTNAIRSFSMEKRYLRKEGSIVWVEMNITPLWTPGEEIAHHIAIVQDITERKQAEEKLKLFRALLDQVTDSIEVIDPVSGRFLDGNRQSYESIGYTRGELSALTVPDIDPLVTRPVFQEYMRNLREADVPLRIESQHLCKDGTTFPVEVSAQLLYHDREYLVAVVRDITERKKEEEERLKRERLLSLMLNTGPGCIKRVASDGTLLHMNPAGLCMIELEKEEDAIGRCVFDVVVPAYRASFIEMHEAVIKGESRTLQFEIQGFKGMRRWMETYAVPFRNPVTGHIEQLAITHDITTRRQAEEALANSEVRFRTVVEGTSDWMWEVDAQGRYTYSSPRVRDLLGYGPEEMLGKTPFDFMRQEEAQRVGALFGSIIEARSPFDRLENTQRHKDGHLVVLECRGVPILDAVGALCGYRGFDRDVTIQKRAEQALRLSEERYARATAIGKVGVWELDAVTGLYYGDVNLKALFGYESDELSTDPYVWLGLVHPEDQSLALKAWEGIVSGSTDDYYYELRMIRKDGTIIWTDVRGHAERDEHGRLQRLIGATVDITERKQAISALQISQMTLQQTLQASNTGLWDWNIETNEVQLSREWKRQLGYEEAELPDTFESWESRLHPDDRDRAVAYAMRYRNNPAGAFRLDFRMLHKDGTYRWIESQASFVTEADGRRVRLLGSHTDITERKQAEETLFESEARFRTLVSNIPGAIYRCAVDKEWTMSYLSEAIFDIVGYPAGEFIGNHTRSYASVIHPDDRQIVEEKTWTSLRERRPYVLEYRVIHANGTIRWVYEKGQGVCTQDGEVRFLDGAIFDITERTRTESELQRSHTFLRQVIDTDPNFIFAKDRYGRFTLVNKAIAEAYGTTVENLLGKTDADFNLNRDEVASFAKRDLEVLDSLQERFIPEEKITDATGQIRWLQTVKRPLLDDTGRATMVLGASTDITTRKGVEQALRRRESDLHAAIVERERISEDLHDGILQSIYAIGLGLEACKPLIADQPKKSATKLNAELQRTIGQLNHVLEEVRNFIAGLESHILDGQEFDVVLRTMVHALADSYSIPCRVTIEKAAAQHLSTEQAYHVMNVAREALSNSFRHSHARRITLSLKCLRRTVRLSVRDNGVGFKPSSVGGAGHGLANMASRARKIGGNFTLLSKPRGGTKVVVDIPMRCTDAGD